MVKGCLQGAAAVSLGCHRSHSQSKGLAEVKAQQWQPQVAKLQLRDLASVECGLFLNKLHPAQFNSSDVASAKKTKQ